MGKRDAHLSVLVNHLFSGARVLDDEAIAAVWASIEFLWIDGSLFYRAFNWAATGASWGDYTKAVCDALVTLLTRCPKLRAVVYSIDKYGHGTRAALPKETTQAHRYEGHQKVANPSRVYQLQETVAGCSSIDTFGDTRARMAFNAMVSAEIIKTLRERVYDETTALELAIVDGAVARRLAPEGAQPDDFLVGDGAPENEVYRAYPHVIGDSPLKPANLWCSHSEGDVAMAHWVPQFIHLKCMVHSSDIDLQQVALQIVRRLVDGGKRIDELQPLYIFKRYTIRSGTQEHIFDVRRYFQLACSIVQPLLHESDPSHPVDVWAAITAISGNDFCAPWLCSEDCRLGKKDNDGIRLESVWAAFVKHGREMSPFFMPVTMADAHSSTWSSLQLRAYVYPMEMRVDAWALLMQTAAHMQMTNLRRLKVGGSEALLRNRSYVQGQVRRIAWALSYYANAAMIGDRMPRGVELTVDGRSVHGWMLIGGTALMSDRTPPRTETVCGLSEADAPSRPPSPGEPEPLETLLERYGD